MDDGFESVKKKRRLLPHPLTLQLPAHQPPDRIQWIHTLEQHRVYRGGDGHFDSVLGGEVDDGAGGRDAFDNGGLLLEIGVELLALAEGFAEGAVAAFGGEATGGEVADAGD